MVAQRQVDTGNDLSLQLLVRVEHCFREMRV